MIEICSKEKCTGCSACSNKCPKHCITMDVGDKLGHLYPLINKEVCIDCGLCKKVCPIVNPLVKSKPHKAYASWDKSEAEYMSSTSGGVASAISRQFIKKGGIVYGCSMLPGVKARHIRISTIGETYKLKGSKYVQSSTEGVYANILNDLMSDRSVLFIGTPCQVAAARKFVGKFGKNLFTIDLICHGVPSQKYLLDCTKKIIKDYSNVIAVFRNRNIYQLGLKDVDKDDYFYLNTLEDNRFEPTYINNFFNGFTIRNSCHNCTFAKSERVSDLTIGDFWGLGRKVEFVHSHPFGCSVVLPITDKGETLVESIHGYVHLYERTVEEAIEGNDKLRHPTQKTKATRLFLLLLPHIGIVGASCVGNSLLRFSLYFNHMINKIKRWIKKMLGF